MDKNELLTVHFLFRPQDMNYIYMYGAKIHFEDEDLLYQNAIISPGKAIISWKERDYKNSSDITLPGITLPELLNDINYQIKIVSQEEPQNSIALALTTFHNGEQLDYQIFTSKETKFSLEPKETEYQLDLISLSNQRLHFQHLLLAKASIMDDYTFTVKDICFIRTILVHYNNSKNVNKLYVRVRTHTSTVQTIGFTPQEDHLFIFIPIQVNGQGEFTEQQLIALAKYVEKFRNSGYILQIENNQSTMSLVKTIRQYISKK